MTDPNFLFSLPPFVEQKDGVSYIALAPSGEDDSQRMQAAVNRLDAVGGGTVRLAAGSYTASSVVYMPGTVELNGVSTFDWDSADARNHRAFGYWLVRVDAYLHEHRLTRSGGWLCRLIDRLIINV